MSLPDLEYWLRRAAQAEHTAGKANIVQTMVTSKRETRRTRVAFSASQA